MIENDDKVNILMRSPIFRDLPKDALGAIARAVQDMVASKHTIISREGDPGDSLYIISSGRVRIFGRNEKGVEIDLAIQGPGDTFGEMALLTGEPGNNLTFDSVLLVGDGDKISVGQPTVKGAKVSAVLVEHLRGEKLRIFKFKRRRAYRKRRGHRDSLTRIRGIAQAMPPDRRISVRFILQLAPQRFRFNGKVRECEKDVVADLRLGWKGPDGQRRPLTDESVGDTARVLLADSRETPREWLYTTDQPADDWFQPTFAANGWQRGPGGFGQRGTPGSIMRTAWTSRDIWLRTSFSLDKLPSALALDLHHDDGVEVFLNGIRVYQAKGFLKQYDRIALEPAARDALRVGENTVAVHCRQTTGGQYIDVGLVEARRTLDVARAIREQGVDVWGEKLTSRYVEVARQLELSRKTHDRRTGDRCDVRWQRSTDIGSR